ncbi:Sensor protein KdpD, partial [Pseudomonas syringae pv. actinidiae]
MLVGQSRRHWRRRVFGGGVAARLLREGHGLEISVLDDSEELPDQPPRARP